MSKHIGIRGIAAMGGALALAVALPLGALAEVAEPTVPTPPATALTAPVTGVDATPGMPQAPVMAGRGGRGGSGARGFGVKGLGIGGFGFGMGIGTGTGDMTEAQKAAYQDALNAYTAIEDEQLANLVGAGVLTQAEADARKAQRANQQALGEIDISNWSDDQLTAIKQALAKSGDERKQALSALADSLQLTQAQADALGALADGQTDLWQQISGQTDDATMDALDAMQHAQLSYTQALERAGIGGIGSIGGRGVNEKIERGMQGASDADIEARNTKKRTADGSADGILRGGIGKGF